MKSISLTFGALLLLIFNIAGLAQKDNKSEISDSITIEELKDHLYFLASDEMKGRMTGSKEYINAAEYAANEFEKAGLLPICTDSSGNLTYFQDVSFFYYENSPNVIAYIEGTDSTLKHEFIGIGAHLDHLGVYNEEVRNGADDNASGCTAVLEIAEALSFSKPKRSVVFVLFTGEEIGLYGSKHFVKHSPFNIDSMQLFINLDMIGRSDGETKGIAPIGFNKGPEALENLLSEVNEESPDLKFDYKYAKSNIYFSASDHYWFYVKGVPVVFFFNGLHDDYHQASDDAEKIDFEFLQKVSILSYNVIMKTANRESGLRHK